MHARTYLRQWRCQRVLKVGQRRGIGGIEKLARALYLQQW
jgi:hypothetical protein